MNPVVIAITRSADQLRATIVRRSAEFGSLATRKADSDTPAVEVCPFEIASLPIAELALDWFPRRDQLMQAWERLSSARLVDE